MADEFGTWITGYAAIGDWNLAGGPEPRHILGVDIAALDWRRDLILAGLERAVLCWIILGVPLSGWLVTRKQREQNEVIRNLSEAMEQSGSAIMIIDHAGRIEYGNRGLCRQLGYVRRELIGHSWRKFHDEDGTDLVLSEISANLQAGQPWEGDWTSRRKDGTVFPVRGVFTPVKHRNGAIACFVAVFDDVTEVKRREAEMQEATELAQAGDRAKGHFLATMSHEVRTPLNGIVGFTSLLLDTPLNDEQREYVQTIRMSTEALIQLTGDILDFARIESGRLKLDPSHCDPREFVEDALDMLATKAADKGLELLHRVAPEVPAAVLVDAGRLRQVLGNLIGNAVKFTEHGEVEVTVARVAEGETVPPVVGEPRPGPELCTLLFTVRDTGIGIAPEHQPKLFRAFTQVDDSTTRRYGGTGLGLAISRNIVNLMGGNISLESKVGEGSSFRFSIRVPVASPPPPPHDLRGARIVVAAPAGPWRRELIALLRDWGGEGSEVDSPDAVPAIPGQLVLTDVSPDLARDLAARAAPAAGWDPASTIGLVPISTANDLRTALRRHFRLLVNKPIHHDALFALLAGAQRRGAAPVGPTTSFGFRVLVAEDNAVNQRLIMRVLANLGCTPTLAENGREALEVLTAHPGEFDLLLLDMHMPELDGLATVSAIRAGQAGPEAQRLWVIALTADAREQQRAQAMDAGLNGYLTKPLNLAELDAALSRLRDERGGAPA